VRFVGIDIGSETHYVAAVDNDSNVLLKPTPFKEESGGYEKLRQLLGDPASTLVAVEATGHFWQNLLAYLVADGFGVALLNPLRTRRFAEGELARAKTDSVDALQIARLAAEKKLAPTGIPDAASLEIRELVRWRDRLLQEFGDKVRQLHRLVDLGFPELKRILSDLGSPLATELLRRYPTAAAFERITSRRLAGMPYGKKQKLDVDTATAIVTAAKSSVGRHHGEVYRRQVVQLCEDLERLRERLDSFDGEIGNIVANHKIASLLTTIDGIGDLTALHLIAELGNPARFRDAGALAAYVGVVPGLWTSGKKTRTKGASISRMGNARLRRALYMPTLAAVRFNPWLKAFYEHLVANGKERMVAVVACMRKLVTAIYSVAKNERPFECRLATSEVSA